MNGNLERIFRSIIYSNARRIGEYLLCPISESLINIGIDKEEEILERFFNKLKNLEKNPLDLDIPKALMDSGISKGRIIVKCGKTHKRRVKYPLTQSDRLVETETSDVVILVTHECIGHELIQVDEKISFFQMKLENRTTDGTFEINARQWYLMRYWPEIYYGNNKFNLISSKGVPDVCSFFLFLFRRESIRYFKRISISCITNAICQSTPYMSIKIPRLRNITDVDLIKKKKFRCKIDFIEGAYFFKILWCLLLTYLGAHDNEGKNLMKAMFPQIFNTINSDPINDEIEERSSIGLLIKIQVKTKEE